MRVPRRTFLEWLSLSVASLAAPACNALSFEDDKPRDVRPGSDAVQPVSTTPQPTIKSAFLPNNPFHLGVASGDPQHDRVLLWTRLVDAPMPTREGSLRVGELAGLNEITVGWIVALDPDLTNVVRSGVAVAQPESAHTVRVDVDGLNPSTTYFYQFTTSDHTSITGRTRTLPAPDSSPGKMRFAIASCQNWQEGFYAAHAHLAKEEIDFVLFLGDYIYEEGVTHDKDAVRKHEGDSPKTLTEYRRRHALYKTDANLQAAHAAHPWIAIWDDHEVAGNYASQFDVELPVGPAGTPEISPSAFLARRAAAYEAYWEHMPVRVPAPVGPSMPIFRDFKLGTLGRVMMLDGRQYRTKPPCDGKVSGSCDERHDSVLSMLGDGQEQWLLKKLEESTSSGERWRLIGNGTMMSPAVVAGSVVNTDQWDGFTSERQRIFDAFAKTNGVVVMTGDIHCTVMSELPRDATNSRSPKVGVELVTTSMSSRGIPAVLDAVAKVMAGAFSHMKYMNSKERGYLVCELTADEITVSLRGLVDDTAASAIRTIKSWKIKHGEAKIENA